MLDTQKPDERNAGVFVEVTRDGLAFSSLGGTTIFLGIIPLIDSGSHSLRDYPSARNCSLISTSSYNEFWALPLTLEPQNLFLAETGWSDRKHSRSLVSGVHRKRPRHLGYGLQSADPLGFGVKFAAGIRLAMGTADEDITCLSVEILETNDTEESKSIRLVATCVTGKDVFRLHFAYISLGAGVSMSDFDPGLISIRATDSIEISGVSESIGTILTIPHSRLNENLVQEEVLDIYIHVNPSLLMRCILTEEAFSLTHLVTPNECSPLLIYRLPQILRRSKEETEEEDNVYAKTTQRTWRSFPLSAQSVHAAYLRRVEELQEHLGVHEDSIEEISEMAEQTAKITLHFSEHEPLKFTHPHPYVKGESHISQVKSLFPPIAEETIVRGGVIRLEHSEFGAIVIYADLPGGDLVCHSGALEESSAVLSPDVPPPSSVEPMITESENSDPTAAVELGFGACNGRWSFNRSVNQLSTILRQVNSASPRAIVTVGDEWRVTNGLKRETDEKLLMRLLELRTCMPDVVSMPPFGTWADSLLSFPRPPEECYQPGKGKTIKARVWEHIDRSFVTGMVDGRISLLVPNKTSVLALSSEKVGRYLHLQLPVGDPVLVSSVDQDLYVCLLDSGLLMVQDLGDFRWSYSFRIEAISPRLIEYMAIKRFAYRRVNILLNRADRLPVMSVYINGDQGQTSVKSVISSADAKDAIWSQTHFSHRSARLLSTVSIFIIADNRIGLAVDEVEQLSILTRRQKIISFALKEDIYGFQAITLKMPRGHIIVRILINDQLIDFDPINMIYMPAPLLPDTDRYCTLKLQCDGSVISRSESMQYCLHILQHQAKWQSLPIAVGDCTLVSAFKLPDDSLALVLAPTTGALILLAPHPLWSPLSVAIATRRLIDPSSQTLYNGHWISDVAIARNDTRQVAKISCSLKKPDMIEVHEQQPQPLALSVCRLQSRDHKHYLSTCVLRLDGQQTGRLLYSLPTCRIPLDHDDLECCDQLFATVIAVMPEARTSLLFIGTQSIEKAAGGFQAGSGRLLIHRVKGIQPAEIEPNKMIEAVYATPRTLRDIGDDIAKRHLARVETERLVDGEPLQILCWDESDETDALFVLVRRLGHPQQRLMWLQAEEIVSPTFPDLDLRDQPHATAFFYEHLCECKLHETPIDIHLGQSTIYLATRSRIYIMDINKETSSPVHKASVLLLDHAIDSLFGTDRALYLLSDCKGLLRWNLSEASSRTFAPTAAVSGVHQMVKLKDDHLIFLDMTNIVHLARETKVDLMPIRRILLSQLCRQRDSCRLLVSEGHVEVYSRDGVMLSVLSPVDDRGWLAWSHGGGSKGRLATLSVSESEAIDVLLDIQTTCRWLQVLSLFNLKARKIGPETKVRRMETAPTGSTLVSQEVETCRPPSMEAKRTEICLVNDDSECDDSASDHEMLEWLNFPARRESTSQPRADLPSSDCSYSLCPAEFIDFLAKNSYTQEQWSSWQAEQGGLWKLLVRDARLTLIDHHVSTSPNLSVLDDFLDDVKSPLKDLINTLAATRPPITTARSSSQQAGMIMTVGCKIDKSLVHDSTIGLTMTTQPLQLVDAWVVANIQTKLDWMSHGAETLLKPHHIRLRGPLQSQLQIIEDSIKNWHREFCADYRSKPWLLDVDLMTSILYEDILQSDLTFLLSQLPYKRTFTVSELRRALEELRGAGATSEEI